ncbi:MAG: twin-arginine translocase TatA/TatE family subunit [Bacteroidota bacterium]
MINFILLGMPGVWEILLIVLALLLIFGGRKIPEIMKGFGKGIREFKDATGGKHDEEKDNQQSGNE